MVNVNRVYISGKVTGLEKEVYLDNFDSAEKFLRSQGFYVVNPAKILENTSDYLDYGEIMKLSMELLDMCDSIYMLRGWETSKGARMEKEYAYTTGRNIFYEGNEKEDSNTNGG